MTTATRARAGWRPSQPGERPSLGGEIIAWAHDMLRSPADDREPFAFTPEQQQHVLMAYELDPTTGRRLYRRAHEEQAKGWGKSPFAAALALCEFVGPCVFDGWDADGQPVAVPRHRPWVQIAAVSEDQTANTYHALYGFLMANGGSVAQALSIDPGLTLLRRHDKPDAYLERVTASAGSREGQPVTFAVLDEPQLWTPSNRGLTLADVILRNLAKTDGWGLFTGNAPVIGERSAAEVYGTPTRGALHLARRVSETPQAEWDDERMRDAIEEVYGDAWWFPRQRLLDEVRDPTRAWTTTQRLFFNVRGVVDAADVWISEALWAEAAGEAKLDAGTPTYACMTIAHDHRSAAVAIAQRHGDRVVTRIRRFPEQPLADGEYVPLAELEQYAHRLHQRYPARVMRAALRTSARDGLYAAPGPEVVYHGAFAEAAAQRLTAQGIAMLDMIDSAERMAPHAETLHSLVIEGKLEHDGDASLTAEIAAVRKKEAAKGWVLTNASPAVRATVYAVARASQPPRAVKAAVFRSM